MPGILPGTHFGAAIAGRDAITHIHLHSEVAQAFINKKEEKAKLETDIKELRESIEQQRSLQSKLEKGSRAYQRIEESIKGMTTDVQQYTEELEQINEELTRLKNPSQGKALHQKITIKASGQSTVASNHGIAVSHQKVTGKSAISQGSGVAMSGDHAALFYQNNVSFSKSQSLENPEKAWLFDLGYTYQTIELKYKSLKQVTEEDKVIIYKELGFLKDRYAQLSIYLKVPSPDLAKLELGEMVEALALHLKNQISVKYSGEIPFINLGMNGYIYALTADLETDIGYNNNQIAKQKICQELKKLGYKGNNDDIESMFSKVNSNYRQQQIWETILNTIKESKILNRTSGSELDYHPNTM